MIIFKSILSIFLLTAVGSEALADAVSAPLYKPKQLVGEANPIPKELDARISGIQTSNAYEFKDVKGKMLLRHQEIVIDKDGGFRFDIQSATKPAIRIAVSYKLNGGIHKLQIQDTSDGSGKNKSAKKNLSLAIPINKASQKIVNQWMKGIYQFCEAAEQRKTFELESEFGPAPPNFEDLCHLAVLETLRLIEPKKDSGSRLRYFNFVNYVLLRIDGFHR